MNKNKVDALIPKAFDVLEKIGIAEKAKKKSDEENKENINDGIAVQETDKDCISDADAKNKEDTNDGDLVVPGAYKGYISNFGAAITMGSFRAAIAFFSREKKETMKGDRNLLMKAIYMLITEKEIEAEGVKAESLLNWACRRDSNETEDKEKVINATLALKLAMNRYKVDSEGANKASGKS